MSGPTNIVMIGEIGTDVDEKVAAILACYAVRQAFVALQAFIANHVHSMARAQNAKQIFMALGLGDVPVGAGERGFGASSLECEADPRFLASPVKIERGRHLLRRALEQAPDHSVVLVLNSGYTDAVWLWMDDPSLFLTKVRRVVIMGGVETEGGLPKLSSEGFLIPSIGRGGAANNNFDPGSALHLYDAMQRSGVPTVTTTRFVAYQCKIPFDIFDRMSKDGCAIGVRTAEIQHARIRELWDKSNAPLGSFERGDLPARCDRTWFVATFCGGIDPGPEDVVPYIVEVAWYDPINLIASSDALHDRFFRPYRVEVGAATHEVIGLSEADHGVRDPADLRRFMEAGVMEALRLGQTPISVF